MGWSGVEWSEVECGASAHPTPPSPILHRPTPPHHHARPAQLCSRNGDEDREGTEEEDAAEESEVEEAEGEAEEQEEEEHLQPPPPPTTAATTTTTTTTRNSRHPTAATPVGPPAVEAHGSV